MYILKDKMNGIIYTIGVIFLAGIFFFTNYNNKFLDILFFVFGIGMIVCGWAVWKIVVEEEI